MLHAKLTIEVWYGKDDSRRVSRVEVELSDTFSLAQFPAAEAAIQRGASEALQKACQQLIAELSQERRARQ